MTDNVMAQGGDLQKQDDSGPPLFGTVAMDITSFCNLKCPFCLSSHDLPNVFMDEDIFAKAIALIPMAAGNNFLFSCLYEPTLHPRFLDYVNMIPPEQRQKVFLTTNLAKRLDNEVFRGLSVSGLHHINISLDSLDPATYETFRKGARFGVFQDNLDRLVEIFAAATDPPEIFYISMVNRLNYREMPALIEQCASRYRAAFHEVREYWLLTRQRELDWCVDNKLSATELTELQDSLAGLSYTCSFAEAGRDLGILLPDNNYRGEEVVDEEGWRDNLYHNPYEAPSVRIQADGKIEILGRNTRFSLRDIESPVTFMGDLHAWIARDIEKTNEMRRLAGAFVQQTMQVDTGPRVRCVVDEVFYDPKTVRIRGWCFHRDEREVALALTIQGREVVRLPYAPQPSPDVAAVHGDAATRCRFEVRINLNYRFTPEDLAGTVLSAFERGAGRSPVSRSRSLGQKVRERARRYLG